MSHGQATVGRGFSVNRQLMTDNLNIRERSIIAHRLIHYYIHILGGAKTLSTNLF